MQIQNAAGTALLNADTSGMSLTVGGNILPLTSPTLGSTAPNIATNVDGAGTANGTFSQMAIGNDGLPIVAFVDGTTNKIDVTKCGNETCSSGNTTTTSISTLATADFLGLAIPSDGKPVIAYHPTTTDGLQAIKCANTSCTSVSSETTILAGTTAGQNPGATIGSDGLPVLASANSSNSFLTISHCSNSACTAFANVTPTTKFSVPNATHYNSITIGGDGFPVVAATGNGAKLTVFHCNAFDCSGTVDQNELTTNAVSTGYTSIAAAANGLPMIAFYDGTAGNLQFMQCTNYTCSTGANTDIVADGAGVDLGEYNSIALGSDSLPIIAYYDTNNGNNLHVLHCGNASCTSGNVTNTLDTTNDVGKYTSIHILPDGLPVTTSYQTTATADLHVVRCGSIDCSTSTTTWSGGLNLGSSSSTFNTLYAGTISTGSSPQPFSVMTGGSDRLTIDNAGNTTINQTLRIGSIGTATGQLYVSGSLPNAPVFTTTTNLSGLGDVFVQGRYAYVTSFSNTKLLIYDVSNPASATLVNGTGTTLAGVTNAGGISVQGHYAYILSYGSNEMSVYDVSNPSSPTLVSTVTTVTQPFGLTVSGRYAYLTGYSSGKLQIFDINNPVNPVSISSTSTTNANPCAVRVQGNYAYVTVGGSGTAFMQIFNVSNPASPTSVSNTSVGAGSACTSGNANNSAMFVQGRYAYYPFQSANQVKVYDVSNPASPSVAATISTGSGPNGVFVQNRYLYVTARDSNRIEAYDISNMASVSSVGNIATGNTTSSLFVQGRYLYVGVGGSSTFDIFDLGGAYIQQFEAGGAELGTLTVDSNSMFAGDVNIQGGTTIGQGLQVSGDLGVSGMNVNFANGGDITNWTLSATTLPAINFYYSSATYNGYAYLLGGSDNTTDYSGVYYAKLNADGSIGSFTATTSLPAAEDRLGTVIINGYIYAIGGGPGASETNAVYFAKIKSDGTIGAWTQTASMPTSVKNFSTATANGFVYVLGGDTGGTAQTTTYYAKANADGTLGLWSSGPAIAATRQSGAVISNNFIYLIGGDNATVTTTNTYFASINPTTGAIGSFTSTTSLPTALAPAQSVITLNGRIYVVGGNTDTGTTATANVYYATLSNTGGIGTWSTSANPMPVIKRRIQPIAANGYIYMLGGAPSGSSTPTNTVYYTSTSRVQIAGSLDLVGPNGGNLANAGDASQGGSIGGSITAGNIMGIGSLQIQGQGNFAQGVSIGGNLTVQSAEAIATNADNNSAFLIGDKKGNTIVNVSAVANGNLLNDGNFEGTAANVNPGWSFNNGVETITNSNDAGHAVYGTQSLKVVTTAAASLQGVIYKYLFKPNTTYTFSAYVSLAANGGTKYYFDAWVNNTPVTCSGNGGTNLTFTTTVTRYSCTFTTGSTIGSPNVNYVEVLRDSTDAVARTIYLDGAQLEQGSTATNYGDPGIVMQNLVANPSFEGGLPGWSAKASITSFTQSSDYALYGNYDLKLVTGTAVSDRGVAYNVPLQANTQYSMSVWLRTDTGTTSNVFAIGRQDSGSDTSCLTAQTITSVWAQYTCTFTTGSSVNSTTNIYVKQPSTNTTSYNIYIDGVTLSPGASALAYTPPADNIDINSYLNNISLNAGNNGEIQPWRLSENATSGNHSNSSICIVNNFIYLLDSAGVAQYAKVGPDGDVGSWTLLTSQGNNVDSKGCATYNGYLYAVGGSGPSGTVQYAKPGLNGDITSWTTTTPLLTQVSFPGVSVANGYLYVVGGAANLGTPTTVTQYAKINADGSIGQFFNGASLGTAASQIGAVAASNYLWAVGGIDGSGNPLSTVNCIGISSTTGAMIGSWTACGTLPVAKGPVQVVVINGYIYAVGGTTNNVTPVMTSNVEIGKIINGAIPTTSWSTSAYPLPAARGKGGIATYNGYIYMVSGRQDVSTTSTSTIYYTSTARTTISGSLDLLGPGGQDTTSSSDGGIASLGGSITAGNITGIGNLQIQGGGFFVQSVGIGNNLAVFGDTSLQGNASVGSRYGNRLFSDNFESGNFGLWDGVSTTGSPSVQSSTVHNGKYAASFSPSATISDATVNFAGQSTVYAREWVNVTSKSSTNLNIFSLVSSSGNWDIYMNNSSQICIFGSLGGNNCYTSLFTLGSWHLIEARITVGASTGTTSISIDGVTNTPFSGNATNGTANITQFIVGQDNASNTGVMLIDDISLDNSTTTGTGSSLNVDDTLHVGGTSTFGSSAIFQNANGNVLSVDSGTGNITTGRGNLNVYQGVTSPTASLATAAGGTLAANTYSYRVAAMTEGGVATAVDSSPLSISASLNNKNTLTWTAATGATGYTIWRAVGVLPQCNWGSTTVSGGATTTFVDTGSITFTGSACKSSAGAGSSIGNVNLNDGSAINLDTSGNAYLYKNNVNNQIELANWNNNGSISLQADSFNFQDTNNGVTEFQITSGNGSAIFRPQTDNTSAFQIQNSSGTTLFNVDTTTAKLTISNPSAAAGQTLLSINNSSGNSILDVKDLNTTFGSAATAGAFISNMSAFDEDFMDNKTTTAVTADTTTGLGDSNAFTFDTFTGTATTYSTPTGTTSIQNGTGRFSFPATSGTGLVFAKGHAVAAYNGTYAKANLPVVQMKVKPSTTAVTDDYRIGLIGLTTAASGTNDASPTDGIYFSKENGTSWVGVVRSGSSNVGTVTCSGTISTTQFATLRIQVESPSSVRFLVDNDASDGINFIDCGTVGVNTNPTVALTLGLMVEHTAASTSTFDVDYLRTWQDDSPIDSQTPDTAPADSPAATDANTDSTLPVSIDGATNITQQIGIIDFTTATSEDTVINGDLFVHGTIYADKIKANEIEGLSIFTDQLASLQQKLNEASSTSTNPDGTTTTNTIIQTATTTLNLSDGLTVGGDASFHGNVFFYKLVTFTEKTLFNNDVTFAAHVTTDGAAPTYSLEAGAGSGTDTSGNQLAKANVDGNDTSGSLNVTTGNNTAAGKVISVTFAKPFAKSPHVILSATNDQAAGVKYYVQSTATGFTIYLIDAPASSTNLQFNYFVIQ